MEDGEAESALRLASQKDGVVACASEYVAAADGRQGFLVGFVEYLAPIGEWGHAYRNPSFG